MCGITVIPSLVACAFLFEDAVKTCRGDANLPAQVTFHAGKRILKSGNWVMFS